MGEPKRIIRDRGQAGSSAASRPCLSGGGRNVCFCQISNVRLSFLPTLIATVEPHSSRKEIVRGALTNGYDWIFLIFYLDENGIGGTYGKSPTIKIQVSGTYPYRVVSPGPDIVAGILAYWVRRTLFFLVCSHGQMLDGTQLC